MESGGTGRKCEKVGRRLGGSKQARLLRVDEGHMNPPKDETSAEKALRNELILREIFANIPTDLLLFPCSLVNKTWNTEVRKFVRDNRRCTVGNKQLTTTACEFLQEFNRLCDEITANGRVIPFNSLRLPFYQRWDVVCCTDDEELLYSNLTSNTELKLRYLEVWRAGNFEARDGICYRLLRALLEKKSYEIRRLEIDCSPIFEEFYQDGNAWNPQFSELEVLDIAPGFDAEKDGPEAKRKETTRWLLKNAPNLKKIVIDQLTCLKIVPAEILMTVELVLAPEFGFCVEKEEDIRSLPTLPDKVCGIMQGIYINSAPFFNYLEHTENVGEMEGELRGWNPLHHFETTLEGVLRNEHKNLERITLHDAYPVGRLSHPPLSNLSSIAINTMKVRNHSQVWNAIASINFERAMPNLKEVTIILTTNCWDPWNGWPTANQDISPFCCISAHKLKLEFGFQEINLSPLQTMFPNLSQINLTFVHREVDKRDLELLKQIMESWPRIVELEFSGVSQSPWSTLNPPIRNYDADFLGMMRIFSETCTLSPSGPPCLLCQNCTN